MATLRREEYLVTCTEAQLKTKNEAATTAASDDKKYLSNRGGQMAVWRVCPMCGRELPEQCFPHYRGQLERRGLCKRCAYGVPPEPSPDPESHPGHGRRWTPSDENLLAASVGRRPAEVARELGRSVSAVKWHVCMSSDLRMVGGVISRRSQSVG